MAGVETDLSPLRSALARLRLEGAIFLRSEFTEAWAYESPPAGMASMLHPGAERLILFHLVAAGRCWVALPDGERHWAECGDVIVVPYGDQHRVGGTTPAACVPITTLLSPPPWETFPVVRLGSGGERTEIVCGYLHSEDRLFDPAMRAFPSVFVAHPPGGSAAGWVQASIAYALEASEAGAASPSLVATRLPELILTEVLGLHLATAPAADHGWMAALHDPLLGPAMALLHGAPERRWTVADLAADVAVSRSVLDERFRHVLGRSPIRYLTEWRMHVAEDLLATTDLTVLAIARRVGYESEEAFSRAFKRETGLSPAHWRARA